MMEHNPSLEDRVKELARLLGIAVDEQLHRALEAGEKDGEAKPVATLDADRVPCPRRRPEGSLDRPGDQGAVSSVAAACRGPSGNLYIAHDGETGAEVTLKLLPAGIELDDEIVSRLRAELSVTRAVARIRPNVAIVHDCDRTADGRDFLVLEPLDGRSLADVIGQEGALPVERALRLAFEIAMARRNPHDEVPRPIALDLEAMLIGPGADMVADRLLLARGTRNPRQRSEMAPERLRLKPGQRGRLHGDPFPSSHHARPYRAGIRSGNSPRARFTRVIPATTAALPRAPRGRPGKSSIAEKSPLNRRELLQVFL